MITIINKGIVAISKKILLQLKWDLRVPRSPLPIELPIFETVMYSVNWVAATVFQHNFMAAAKKEIAIKVDNNKYNKINPKIIMSLRQRLDDNPIMPNKSTKAPK